MEKIEPILELAGRVLLAVLFILAGFSKISGFEGTQGYMEAMGVPGVLLPLVILLEIGGGLLLIAGYKTKWISLALAGFCLLSGFIFHFQPEDQIQMILFMKNISITGAFLLLVSKGSGKLSLDARLNAA
ncbi:DoxX family protein [Alphaproteobacteria bacterium 46_93_T64]|nr:DoxX family protein [Alphaproteobacteria bacterium 46_93_T64]